MKTQAVMMLLMLAMPAALVAQEPAGEADAAIEVARAIVATDVQNSEPVEPSELFSADVGTVYFFTELRGDFAPTTVEHVWLHEGEEVARVSLNAQGPRWRTWSSKRILPTWTGSWTVQVIGPAGDVLSSEQFEVGTARAVR